MTSNFTTYDVLKYVYNEASSKLRSQIKMVRNRDNSFNEEMLEFESLSLKLDHLRFQPSLRSIEKILAVSKKQKFESN